MIGTLLVNEVILPIAYVRMIRGEITFIARRHGPLRGYAGGVTDVELFGADGSAIGSVRANIPAWPDLDDESTLTIPLPMRITEMVDLEGGGAEANSPR
jgi:hypothetical protein